MSARDDLFAYLTNNPFATDAEASRSTGIPVIQVKKYRADWLANKAEDERITKVIEAEHPGLTDKPLVLDAAGPFVEIDLQPKCEWCDEPVAEKGTLCADCRYVPEDVGPPPPDPEPTVEPADPLAGFDLTQPTTFIPNVAPILRQPVLRAADLAALLASEVFDAQDAAAYLGIRRNSLEYAASRNRLSFVQYGSKKLFTRTDLDEYRANAVRGRGSRLVSRDPVVVRAGKR